MPEPGSAPSDPAPDAVPDPAPRPDDPAPVAVRLSGVSVQFDGRAVLTGIDLEVRRGEVVALIGPSGGGKSTLLRVVAGLLRPERGEVEVTAPPAFVFQDYRLLPWRSVRGNAGLPRELTGRGLRGEEALALVGMTEHAQRRPFELSGGMKARVAIARALAQDTDVLLMDEPFAALDALVRERFNRELKRLHERTGRTIVLVTHSIREAAYLADRVVVLKRGRVEAVLDTRHEGRLSAYTEGVEAELRALLGEPDSTRVALPARPPRVPWAWIGATSLAALLLAGWSALAARTSPLVLPPPGAVLDALRADADALARHGWATLRTTLLGVLCALGIGVPLGYAMGRARWLEGLLSPFLVALQAVPTIVLAPLLVLWLGYTLASKLVVTALVAVFPVLVSTMVGVREVDRAYRELLRTLGATPWGAFTRLELPGALPALLGGLRLTVALALIGTVVGEFVFLGPGLGYLANAERLNFRVAHAYAAVGCTVLLGIALYGAVARLERLVLRRRG